MGKIYYVMGKSSSGKDTVYKKLMERHPGFRTIVPYTTRPIREGERDGVEYFFVDDERLREMQEIGVTHVFLATPKPATTAEELGERIASLQ